MSGRRRHAQNEFDELDRLNVYDVTDVSECWKPTRTAPISAGWIDINKGDLTVPVYRSRFTSREIKSKYGRGHREELFAGTPPWEVIKILVSNVATNAMDIRRLMFIDISKAYLFAPVVQPNIFTHLLPEVH